MWAHPWPTQMGLNQKVPQLEDIRTSRSTSSRNESRWWWWGDYDHSTGILCRHIKDQVKEAYLDTATMDDGQLLMQFFKKRDTDNNMKLDGLELLTALVEMEGKM